MTGPPAGGWRRRAGRFSGAGENRHGHWDGKAAITYLAISGGCMISALAGFYLPAGGKRVLAVAQG